MLPVFNKTALTKSFAKKCRNLKIRYGRGNVRPGSVRRGRVSREFVRSGNCPIIHLTPIGKFILSSISNGLLFWSVNHTLISSYSELNELPNGLFGTEVYNKMIKWHSDLIFFLSIHVLQPLLLISDKLSTKSDNLLDMYLQLSINFILYVIVLPLSRSFLIGTEKVIYFSVFSPKHSNWPLNSSANSLIIKW